LNKFLLKYSILADGFFNEAFASRQQSPVKDFTFESPFTKYKFPTENPFETNIFETASQHEEEMLHPHANQSSNITANFRQSNYDAFKTPSNQNNIANFQKSKQQHTPDIQIRKLEA